MISRRAILKGAAIASAAALVPTLSNEQETRGIGLPPPNPETLSFAQGGHEIARWTKNVVHLNSRYYSKPTRPHFITRRPDGTTWYSLTNDYRGALDLEPLLHGIESHSIPTVTT